MTVILLALFHAVVVFAVGARFRSKVILTLAAIVMAVVAIEVGSPAYAAIDLIAVMVGFGLGWSFLNYLTREDEKVRQSEAERQRSNDRWRAQGQGFAENARSMDTRSSADEPSHYDVLQVTRHASESVIRAAYRTLVNKHHPDKNLDAPDESSRLTAALNDAYAVLTDPARRQAYDEELDRKSSDGKNRDRPAAAKSSHRTGARESASRPSSPPPPTKSSDGGSSAWSWIGAIGAIFVVFAFYNSLSSQKAPQVQAVVPETSIAPATRVPRSVLPTQPTNVREGISDSSGAEGRANRGGISRNQDAIVIRRTQPPVPAGQPGTGIASPGPAEPPVTSLPKPPLPAPLKEMSSRECTFSRFASAQRSCPDGSPVELRKYYASLLQRKKENGQLDGFWAARSEEIHAMSADCSSVECVRRVFYRAIDEILQEPVGTESPG